MANAFRLGLTGGIGSGKSTVATILAELGAAVIDADAIARSVTAPGGLAIPDIRLAFGHAFIAQDGAMDRDRMRTLAYTDASARRRLEDIVHPLVSQETWRQADVAEAAGHRCLVFDVPLLIESAHWRQKVSQVWVVDCAHETQIARVTSRSALDRTAIVAIMAAQASRQRRLHAADAVIFNDTISLPTLKTHVHALALGFGLSSAHHQAPPEN
jgi:dephospho-CoA kinase